MKAEGRIQKEWNEWKPNELMRFEWSGIRRKNELANKLTSIWMSGIGAVWKKANEMSGWIQLVS